MSRSLQQVVSVLQHERAAAKQDLRIAEFAASVAGETSTEREQSTMAEPAGKRPGERVPSCPSLGVALSSGVVPLRHCFILVYRVPDLSILALLKPFQDLTEFIFTQ